MGLDTILLALFFILFGAAMYLGVRNQWVYTQRHKLIDWYYLHDNTLYVPGVRFDDRFGSYDSWVFNRWYIWNPGTLAGVNWKEVEHALAHHSS